MNEIYKKLNKLSQIGTITKETTYSNGHIFIKNSSEAGTRLVENGIWEIETFFHNTKYIADKSIIKYEDGTIYEERLTVFDDYYKLKI